VISRTADACFVGGVKSSGTFHSTTAATTAIGSRITHASPAAERRTDCSPTAWQDVETTVGGGTG